MVPDTGGPRVVVAAGGTITVAVGEEVVEFALAHREPCLTDVDMWCSAVESLHAWHTAGLGLRLLRRHGLPVWCAPHRAERSPEPCGRLDVGQPR
ncbi:MAG: hypothetical protein HOV94_21695 [Saccharothrix sp.]|nr:hypothetical protein [Saccharothrix sp.]